MSNYVHRHPWLESIRPGAKEMFHKPPREDFPYFPEGVLVNPRITLEELIPGCHKPDCIPSIDTPQWITSEEALDLYPATTEILGLFHVSGNTLVETFAAPLNILNWHEIINFITSDNEPAALTFCPLCQTATGYHRKLGNRILELGVSGLLLRSALVMYDRGTKSLFSQVWSTGIVGSFSGAKLTRKPIIRTMLKNWVEVYPDGHILSKETGYRQYRAHYDANPYDEYLQSEEVRFPLSTPLDKALHPKEIVYVVKDPEDKKYLIIPQKQLPNDPMHIVNGLYSLGHAGGVLFFLGLNDQYLKSPILPWERWIPSEISFYFAARAYFPEAQLVEL